ncbi:MAG: hypothetical protein RR057_03955, partial [Clostridia bacterium]
MKLKKAVICILLAILMVIPLVSCSAEPVQVAKYKDTSISTNMFSYMLSSQKAYFESMFNYTYQTTDYASIWATEIDTGDGVKRKYSDFVFEKVVDSLKMFVVVKQLCNEHKLGITDESVNNAIEAYISNDIATAGDENFLEIALADFGANLDIERDYLITTSLATVLMDYLYGEKGSMKIADSEIRKDFDENYSKIDAVYYSFYNYDKDTDKSTPKVDSGISEEAEKKHFAENFFKTNQILFSFYDTKKENTKLSAEEITAMKKNASNTFEKIESGEITYDAAKELFKDNKGVDFKSSIYNKKDDVNKDMLKAALEMKVGERRLVESDVGMYIIEKTSETEEEFKKMKSKIDLAITQDRISAEADKYYESFKAGDAEFKAVDKDSEYMAGIVFANN